MKLLNAYHMGWQCPLSDAAFRAALDAYWATAVAQANEPDTYREQLDAARARVLALYAERQGEVYEVVSIYSDDDEYRRDVVDVTAKLSRGDKVRVTKVEEET